MHIHLDNKGQTFDDMDGGTESTKGYVYLIHGEEKPQYVMVTNANKEASQVAEWRESCKNSGIPLKDICVTAPSMGLMKDTRHHTDGTAYKVLKGTSKQGASDGGLCIPSTHSKVGKFRLQS